MSHRIFQSASDKYNIDITISIDYVPDGFDYDMILYDKRNRFLGVAKNNGSGGKSITIPNWCMNEDAYKLKVQTKDGTEVVAEEDYNLVFRENKLQGIYLQMCEKMHFNFVLQQKLQAKSYAPGVKAYSMQSFHKCEENYMEHMDAVYMESKEFYA